MTLKPPPTSSFSTLICPPKRRPFFLEISSESTAAVRPGTVGNVGNASVPAIVDARVVAEHELDRLDLEVRARHFQRHPLQPDFDQVVDLPGDAVDVELDAGAAPQRQLAEWRDVGE